MVSPQIFIGEILHHSCATSPNPGTYLEFQIPTSHLRPILPNRLGTKWENHTHEKPKGMNRTPYMRQRETAITMPLLAAQIRLPNV